MKISEALQLAARLTAVSDSPRLDAELLLAFVSGFNRTYFYTWPEKTLEETVVAQYQLLLQRRERGEPIAHITGRREFWSLDLAVDNSTLIPRPDTEVLVEVALEYLAEVTVPNTQVRILDLGTGSGAIALALASERPSASVQGVDQSEAAVHLAQKNAHQLGVSNACFSQGSWLDDVWLKAIVSDEAFDMVVSNPPYIDASDVHLEQGDVRFEPKTALVAAEQGLADIRVIIQLAARILKVNGSIWLEHGWQQAHAVKELLAAAGFQRIETRNDYGGNPRITGGFWS